jgi:hypothetical protein
MAHSRCVRAHGVGVGAKLIGYFNVTLGECTNEVMQIWQWESYKHREQATENLANNPAWEEYTKYDTHTQTHTHTQ